MSRPQYGRMRINLREDTHENFMWLREVMDIGPSKAVCRAIHLFVFALRNERGGRRLVSVNADGTDPRPVELDWDE